MQKTGMDDLKKKYNQMVYRWFENRCRSRRWDLRSKKQVRTIIRLLFERPSKGNSSNRKMCEHESRKKLSDKNK